MNEVWNLDPIYKGFDDEAFASDMEALRACVADYNAFVSGIADLAPIDGLKQGIDWEERISNLVYKLMGYSSLRQSTNTRDSEAGSKMGQIMQIVSATAGAETAWKQWATALPNLMELVEGDPELKDYSYNFTNMLSDSKHLLGSLGEEICAKLHMSGGSAWSDLQSYLTSTVPVSYNDGITNLSSIRNLAYEADPAVRKAAYEAEIACYDRIKDSVAFALNSIKLETISDCQLRGYASPLDRTLDHSHMKRETLEAMLGAMDEYLPKFWQYMMELLYSSSS